MMKILIILLETINFFNIEKEICPKATYYFRLSTLEKHVPLIENLKISDFKIGYHYEEDFI